MADDVLHHHDRIVHQDADGEDEREERDPVEGVAEEMEDHQGQRERGGDGDRHHRRLAPAEHEQDQERDRHHGDGHVEQELVRLLRRGRPVVPGHGDLDVGGNGRSLHPVGLGQDRLGHGDGVAPRALGDGECDRRLLGAEILAGCSRAEEHVLRGLLGSILHLSDVAQVDRVAGMDTHHG
jgi:hypothetical protein